MTLHWMIFTSIIITLLILDLGVFNKKDHKMSFKESLYLSLFYIIISIMFGVYIFYDIGMIGMKEYYTGYVIEKAMSLDNIFIISIVFQFFKIPTKYQHKVLFFGILGVIILRGVMIALGAKILSEFEWVMYIFALILIYTGIKTLVFINRKPKKVTDMLIYKNLARIFNIHPTIEGNKFIIKKNTKIYITPLLMALITIEFMDLIFAIDSIPAIFAITTNPFIVYTSNIFAILGLRAMFFLLSDIVKRFRYVKYSIALILILIGVKILVKEFVDIPQILPLVGTIILLSGGIISSLVSK